MSNGDKNETHAEFLQRIGLDTKGGYVDKSFSEFTPEMIDNYVAMHGEESLVDRIKADKKWDQLAALDKEIEEKTEQAGRAVTRAEYDEAVKKRNTSGLTAEFDELMERVHKYGIED